MTLAGGTLSIGAPGSAGAQQLTLGPQTQLVLDNEIIDGGDLVNQGTISGNVTIASLGSLTNAGMIRASGGSFVVGTSVFTNTLAISTSAFTNTASGTIAVDPGAEASFGPSYGETGTVLNAGAITVGPGSSLVLAAPGSDTVNQGTMDVSGAGASGIIAGALSNAGQIKVEDGATVQVAGPIAAGGDAFDLATDSTLRLDGSVAAGNTVSFQDGSASVAALDPTQFAGALSGFQAGNALDLVASGTQPSDYAASYSAGHILVSRAGQQIASLATAPGEDYSGAAFIFGTDGNGGATMQIAPATPVLMTDTTTGATYTDAASAYAGPYGGLASQFIYGGAHNVAMRATTSNVFLVAGSGTNALAVTSGNNVLGSGAGSAFMVSGSGDDTFFLDGRSGQASWDTVVNFHGDDTMTLWGFTPGISQLSWADNQGASGYTGATLHVDVAGNGRMDDAVTFAGISRDAASHLALSTGTTGGVPYLALSG